MNPAAMDANPARGATSLTRRLLLVLLVSLTAVALVLGVGGFVLIERVAEQAGDRVLTASARAIAETLTVENGEVSLDLPPSALGMLENNERDNVYYSVHVGAELLTGYADLRIPAAVNTLGAQTTLLRYETYRDRRVRIAAEVRRLPRIASLVVVQVAETLAAREAVAQRLLLGLVVLEVLLVAVAGLLVWPAVKWSLRPVTRLRREIDARSRATFDLASLDETGVPTELRGLVHAFNALLARLEKAIERMRHFTADASHQMRTPLAILRTHLAILRQQGTSTDEGRSSLSDVENATERLQRLLVQLVALARADEAATGPAGTGQADLQECLESVLERLEPAATAAGVSLDLRELAFHQEVQGNSALLAEILFNLIDNAIRYNRPGGQVLIGVRVQGEFVHVLVDDDGPGIPHSERERVFQRFHRLPRDQQREGSGLGLAIVRTLAQHLRAEVELGDAPGGTGLRVELRLRRVEGALKGS
jgi:two-component system, OmpR family, sensor histidine kinase TctE